MFYKSGPNPIFKSRLTLLGWIPRQNWSTFISFIYFGLVEKDHVPALSLMLTFHNINTYVNYQIFNCVDMFMQQYS